MTRPEKTWWPGLLLQNKPCHFDVVNGLGQSFMRRPVHAVGNFGVKYHNVARVDTWQLAARVGTSQLVFGTSLLFEFCTVLNLVTQLRGIPVAVQQLQQACVSIAAKNVQPCLRT